MLGLPVRAWLCAQWCSGNSVLGRPVRAWLYAQWCSGNSVLGRPVRAWLYAQWCSGDSMLGLLVRAWLYARWCSGDAQWCSGDLTLGRFLKTFAESDHDYFKKIGNKHYTHDTKTGKSGEMTGVCKILMTEIARIGFMYRGSFKCYKFGF